MLEAIWGGSDAQENSGALAATVDLFARASARTATLLHFAPFDATPVRAEITHIAQGRPDANP